MNKNYFIAMILASACSYYDKSGLPPLEDDEEFSKEEVKNPSDEADPTITHYSCNLEGAYLADYVPIDGSCGLIDIGNLNFSILPNNTLTSPYLLTEGVVSQDGCIADVWRAIPVGLHGCAYHVHTVLTDGSLEGSATLNVYCYEANYTCSENYTVSFSKRFL